MARKKMFFKCMINTSLILTLRHRVNEETMDKLVLEAEQKINELGKFTTTIDDLDHTVGIRLHVIKKTHSV